MESCNRLSTKPLQDRAPPFTLLMYGGVARALCGGRQIFVGPWFNWFVKIPVDNHRPGDLEMSIAFCRGIRSRVTTIQITPPEQLDRSETVGPFRPATGFLKEQTDRTILAPAEPRPAQIETPTLGQLTGARRGRRRLIKTTTGSKTLQDHGKPPKTHAIA
ncbi:hypothetical protein CROQUDRAFT_94377 [Cronartium quercuum f. sp. fusiforme G11]|uniref:Uncharacterized protein n=1 Tax=Cronartium quercuum f. sp. fusiforme G11 TaxID=708437 RepID=A0A9P6NE08_9BASI|nr:hypothetical protein CROQUDRAFT_94377 [Cronartium quercuum f. sp. fusiforme G11]